MMEMEENVEEEEEEEGTRESADFMSSSTACASLRWFSGPIGRAVETCIRFLRRPLQSSGCRIKFCKHSSTGLVACFDPEVDKRAAIHRFQVRPRHFDLPQEVLDRIRAYLPFSSYVRFAAVSKYWRQTAFSPCLLSLTWELHPAEPWIFALSDGIEDEAFLLDPVFWRWRKVKLPFMAQDRVELVSSSNGLLCCNMHRQDLSLLIVNPVRGTTKLLPWCNVTSANPVVGLTVNTDTCDYKVIAINSFELGARTEVYDSRTDVWQRTGRLPFNKRLALVCSFFCKGCFYCWTLGPPESLLIYDFIKKSWRETSIPLPASYSFGKLVEYGGRILLVGLSEASGLSGSISIWEFYESASEMEEIARMPFGMFRDFSGKSQAKYYAESCGEFVYFYAKGNPQLVVCNVSKKPAHWMQLPPDDPFCLAKGEINLSSLRLHPRLVYNL